MSDETLSKLQISILDVEPDLLENDELRRIVQGVVNVRRTTWLDTYPNSEAGVTKEDILNHFRNFNDEVESVMDRIVKEPLTHHLFAALDKDLNVIGYNLPWIDKGKYKLGGIYILPEYQNKGIGSILIEKGMNWIGKENEITLSVATYNERAIRFYKKKGFRIIGEENYDLRNLVTFSKKAIPVYVMVK